MKFLISQNVDGLHAKSGIPFEILAELHGNYTIMKCLDCDSRFSRNEIGWNRDIHGRGSRSESETPNQPACKYCQGRIISSVVNFNEPMPDKEVHISKEHSSKCDLMLVIGSSLSVFPAANLPKIAKQQGARLIILNYDPTGLDSIADMKLRVKAGEFLPEVIKEVKNLLASSWSSLICKNE